MEPNTVINKYIWRIKWHTTRNSIVISPSFPSTTQKGRKVTGAHKFQHFNYAFYKIITSVVQTHLFHEWYIIWMMFGNLGNPPGSPACPGQPPCLPYPPALVLPTTLPPLPFILPCPPTAPPRAASAAHVHQIKSQRTFCSEVYIAIISRGSFCHQVICFCRGFHVNQMLCSLDQLLI